LDSICIDRRARSAANWRAGRQEDGTYCQHAARLVYAASRTRCRQRKLVEGSDLHRFAHGQRVHLHVSPEQVAPRLRVMKPDDPVARVSHDAIYAAIYAQPRGEPKVAMIGALRQAKPTRGLKRTTLAGSAMVLETSRIINRPKDIEVRLVQGGGLSAIAP
jgi:IS30 family transposase